LNETRIRLDLHLEASAASVGPGAREAERFAVELAEKMSCASEDLEWECSHRLPDDDFLQKEGVSASSRLEEVKKSLSIDSVAMFSDSAPEDDETGAALRLRCCYDYLRAEIRRLGNSLNEALPKKLELCVKWRMTLLEFAGWLQLYSETSQMDGWSCREEQSQVVSRIKATKKNSLQLTCEVLEELMGCERIYEKIGRFRVFRSVNNNDILEIQDRGSADKPWKTYGRFEPRATRVLNTLLEAYKEKTEDGWCRMRDGWRQAFLVRNKQAEDEDAGNANEFYNEQIERVLRDESGGIENQVAYWRIKPDPGPLA